MEDRDAKILRLEGEIHTLRERQSKLKREIDAIKRGIGEILNRVRQMTEKTIQTT